MNCIFPLELFESNLKEVLLDITVLKDIEAELNTPNYARLRFGIGQEVKAFDQVKFVLDTWTNEEAEKLSERLKICGEAIESFGLQGLQNTMNTFNGK